MDFWVMDTENQRKLCDRSSLLWQIPFVVNVAAINIYILYQNKRILAEMLCIVNLGAENGEFWRFEWFC